MPWGALAVLLLVAYLLQTAVVPFLGIESLDLFLTLCLFFGLTAVVHEARLAGWLIGFVQDLGSVGPLGVHAFALGLAALALTAARTVVNFQVWWVRAVAAVLAGLIAQLFIVLHQIWWQGVALGTFGHVAGLVLLGAVVNGVLAAGLTQLPLFLNWDRRRRSVPRRRW